MLLQDPAYAPFKWADNRYEELDDYYRDYIPNSDLRKLFLRGLAYAFAERDPKFSKEFKDLEFNYGDVACIFEIVEDIKKYYMEYLQDQQEIQCVGE